MGNTFASVGRDARPLGALIGAAFGLLVILAGLGIADGPARATTVVLGGTTSIVAGALGWLLAPWAVRPGVGQALRVASGVTLAAVPVGALLMGIAFGVGSGNLEAGEAVVAGFGLAVAGLLLLGLPLAGLTFVVASLWVGIVRVVYAAWAGDTWRR